MNTWIGVPTIPILTLGIQTSQVSGGVTIKSSVHCNPVRIPTMSSQFVAYFDDSGHPDDQPAVVVAGLVASIEQWEFLAREWRAVLASEGIHSDIFHMTELVAGRGEYAGWSVKRKKALLGRLICIIRTRTRMSFCAIVPMNAYKEVNDAYALEEVLGAPYAIAGRTVAARLNDWSSKYNRSRGQVQIVFERGTKHTGDLIEVFRRDGFKDISFQGKTETALQAADLLAWECLNAFKKGPDAVLTASFEALLEHPFDHGAYTADDLRKACKQAQVPLRKDLGTNAEISYHSSPKQIRRRKIKS